MLAVFLLASAAAAHAATYSHVPTTFGWIDPSSHTPAVWSNPTLCTAFGDTIGDDALTAPINIGFPFTFGGSTYTQLHVMTNGRLQFGNTYCFAGTQTTGPPRVYTLPYPDANLVNTIRVYGADLDASPNGSGSGPQPTTCTAPGCAVLYTATPIGTAPNRRFVVTWQAVPDWATTNSFFNVQVILNEDGTFVFQYGPNNNLNSGHPDVGWELTTADFDKITYTDSASLTSTAILFFNPLIPTSTPTPTLTPTFTATLTATPTATFTASNTPTFTPSRTPTATATATFTASNTPTFTASATPTATPTATFTASNTPTFTASATPTATATATFTASSTPTFTPSLTPTATATATFTASSTPTFTASSTPTFTASATPTATATPTFTASSTPTFTASATPTATNTATFTPTATSTPTATPTATPTSTPTATPTSTPTRTNTPTATNTATQTSTPTPTNTPTPTPTPVAPAAAALAVDLHGTGTTSNLNQVLESGETVVVEPGWLNANASALALTGAASNLTGPAGPTYAIDDAAADYGSVPANAVSDCYGATPSHDCYLMTVSGPRPVIHWDATYGEALSTGPPPKTWTLHVGQSFPDVPTVQPFYGFIENIFHNGITGGCGGGNFCPLGSTTRAQMAVFLLKSKHGASYVPPPCTGDFADVPCPSLYADWIEQLFAEGITGGCGGNNYCPSNPVTRAQMAAFLLKAKYGSSYTPPTCTSIFTDVVCPSTFADWIEELYDEGITGGCGVGVYCPASVNTRGQMAVFLVRTFGLKLYGP